MDGYEQPFSAAPEVVVADQGSIFTKLAYKYGMIDYLSVHAPLAKGNSMDRIEYTDAIKIDKDPTWWAFGPNLHRIGELNRISHVSTDARYTSDAYRRGIAYALFVTHCHIKVPKRNKDYFDPLLVVSIPADEFKNNKDAIAENILGKYTVKASYLAEEDREYKFDIVLDNLTVLPEGAGTYLDLVQAEKQGIINTTYSQGITAMVSWGWWTISIVLFENGKQIKGVIDSNSMVGMSSVAESIFSRLGIEPSASVAQMDKDMRGEVLKYNGRELKEFPIYKREEIKTASEQGLTWIESKLKRSGLSVDNLVFTGGTSEMFWPYIDIEKHSLRKRLPGNITKVEDAAHEDANGAFRYYEYRMRNSI